MHDTDKLSAAISDLTRELKQHRLSQQSRIVTKDDLEAAKAEIIKAFGERVAPKDLKRLDASSEKLEQAVAADTAPPAN